MWVYEHEAGKYTCSRSPRETAMACVGKRCMAWRWGYINRVDQTYQGKTFSAAEIGVPEGKFPPNTRFRGRKGFCGLAGKPNE